MVFKRDMVLQINPIVVVGSEQLETVSEFVYKAGSYDFVRLFTATLCGRDMDP